MDMSVGAEEFGRLGEVKAMVSINQPIACPTCDEYWVSCPCCNVSFCPDCGMLEEDAPEEIGEEE